MTFDQDCSNLLQIYWSNMSHSHLAQWIRRKILNDVTWKHSTHYLPIPKLLGKILALIFPNNSLIFQVAFVPNKDHRNLTKQWEMVIYKDQTDLQALCNGKIQMWAKVQ